MEKVWKPKKAGVRRLSNGSIIPIIPHSQRYSIGRKKVPSNNEIAKLYQRLSNEHRIILENRIKLLPIETMTDDEKIVTHKELKRVLRINIGNYAMKLANRKLPRWYQLKIHITVQEWITYLNKTYGKNWFETHDNTEHGFYLFGYVKNRTLHVTDFEPIHNSILREIDGWRLVGRNRSALEFDLVDINKTLIEQDQKGLWLVGEGHIHPAYVGQEGGYNPGTTPKNTVSRQDIDGWKETIDNKNMIASIINININRRAFIAFYRKGEPIKKVVIK